MSKAFAWFMVVFSIGMPFLQLGVAGVPRCRLYVDQVADMARGIRGSVIRCWHPISSNARSAICKQTIREIPFQHAPSSD